MTEQEFDTKFHGAVAPRCYGAPYPKFDPAAINESKFEDECKFKSYDVDFDPHTQTIRIDWETQDDCIEHSEFLEEIKRCFTYLKFKGHIHVKIYDRDGYNEFFETVEL